MDCLFLGRIGRVPIGLTAAVETLVDHGAFLANLREVVAIEVGIAVHGSIRQIEIGHPALGSIFGPKVMIVNEFAGSGGDAMPWYFRRAKIGPLVGERTWGGLVGIYDYPQLMDGGFITAPRMAFWSPDGEWDVENHGVAPDVEVDLDPQAVCAGHDPQLEKAVQIVMDELKKNPLPQHKKPAYPNYHPSGEKAVEKP